MQFLEPEFGGSFTTHGWSADRVAARRLQVSGAMSQVIATSRGAIDTRSAVVAMSA